MAAPTFVAQYATAFNASTSPKTAMSAVSISSGDVIVIVGAIEGGQDAAGYPPAYTENGSASLANVTESTAADVAASSCATYIATASESITITAARGSSADGSWYFGANAIRFSGSSGVGNVVTGGGSGSPSMSIITTQANSAIVVIFTDWNATTGTQTFTSNGGAGSATLLTGYPGDGVRYGAAIAYYADSGAAGAKTVGMSAPTGQKWRGIAIEVKGTAGGTTYSHAATGGIATGGAATLKRTRASTASGGVSTGGTATLKRAFANQASGGITTGGAASASKSSGNSYIASGGITTGGAAALKRTQASTANGGISTGGASGLKLVKTVSGSGGIATGGAAALKRAFARSASGGLVTGGTAPLKLVKTTSATGGIVTGGAATASKSSPGQNSHTASGGVATGGAATLKRTQTAVGAGGIATGGAATLKRSFARLASGGLSTGGAAVLKRVRAYLASGGLATGGAAAVTLTAGAFSYVASGGIATGGSASLRILLHYLASGGVTIGGAASAYTWSSVTALPHGDPAFARLSSVAAMERITPLARVA